MGLETLLVSNLNARLSQPRFEQEGDLATAITNQGLSDQSLHFISRQRYRGVGGWSWSIWRDVRPILGIGDYILGTDRRDFYNVGIREIRM